MLIAGIFFPRGIHTEDKNEVCKYKDCKRCSCVSGEMQVEELIKGEKLQDANIKIYEAQANDLKVMRRTLLLGNVQVCIRLR